MKPVVFIDLPRNPLSVNVVKDGGENGNGVSDGGRFPTAKRDNRLALMGYWYSCSPVGFGYVATFNNIVGGTIVLLLFSITPIFHFL